MSDGRINEDTIRDLAEWGLFMRGDVNLGYATESLEHRMMQYGPDILIKDCKKRIAADPYVPPNIARAERVLLEMPEYYRDLLIVAYTIMASRERQSKILSRQLGRPIGRNKFVADMESAHAWYDCFVYSMKKFNRNSIDICMQRTV
jgi:hypothetical protein